MTVFDYGVAVVVGLSVLLGVIRGLVREVLSLAAWVVAFVAAGLFGGWLAERLPGDIPVPELRLAAGYLAVFLAFLVAMSLAAMVIARLAKAAGLGVEDRVLGAAFGAARGLLIVTVLVLGAGLSSLPRHPAWRDALTSGPLEAVATEVKQWLPAELSQRIRYD